MAANNNQLPWPPTDPNDFIGLRNYLVALGERITALSGDSTPPALVTGLTLTPIYPGIYVQWQPALKADKYIIYRNITSDMATATPVAQLRDTSFFDQTASLGSVTIFYWILPENELGIIGPLSAMVSTDNSVAPGPGLIPGALDPGLFPVANPDDDLPWMEGLITDIASGADVADSVTFWASQGEDEDFVVSSSLSVDGYAIP